MALFNSFTNRNNFGVMNFPMLTQGGIPPIEPEASAFIDAAGITDGTQIGAINNLVWRLKYFGLWGKFLAIYPFVGGTATTHKFNLMFPSDLDSAYRLNFIGGWTHSSNGATPNGTNGYADTFINSNTALSGTSTHLSMYSRTLSVGTQIEMGTFDTISTSILQLRPAANAVFGLAASGLVNFTTTTDARGFWLATKRANNDRQVYRNGISEGTSTTNDTTAFPSFNIFIGARNNNGSPVFYSNKQFAFVSIGTGLTTTEAANFNTCVVEYQTALSRNV